MTKSIKRNLSALTALLLLSISSATAIDTISFSKPMIHPDTPENREKIDGIFRKASVLASLRYEDLFSVEYGGTGSEFTIEAVVSFSEGEPVGSLSMSKRGTNSEQSFPILGEFSEDKIGYYAAGFASLWNGFTDGFRLGDHNLMVVPGSHRIEDWGDDQPYGPLMDCKNILELLNQRYGDQVGRKLEIVELELPPGSMVFLNARTYHGVRSKPKDAPDRFRIFCNCVFKHADSLGRNIQTIPPSWLENADAWRRQLLDRPPRALTPYHHR